MLFSSFPFIFVFLPALWLVYIVLIRWVNRSFALAALVGGSLVFYGYQDWHHIAVIAGSILVNFCLGRALARRTHTKQPSKALLTLGVCFNLSIIGVFKYTDFILSTVVTATGGEHTPLEIALPLGISFYTFQQIAYLVDCHCDGVSEQKAVPYALFVTFFPQLIAGPIVHHRKILPQFQTPPPSLLKSGCVHVGILWFSFGLFKKVAIADTLSPIVGACFDGSPVLTPLAAWTGALAYTFQIYFDFSGYSDMAIGLGLLFGLRLPMNFDSPYKATSIVDFWRRWHMTLSAFLRDYVYIPLGGNRLGRHRRLINLMATMLIGGLWHGASWTFVAWGGIHGLALCTAHGASTLGLRVPKVFGWCLTFLTLIVSWVLFRSESFHDAWAFLQAMVGVLPSEAPEQQVITLDRWAAPFLGVLLAFCLLVPNTERFLTARPRGLLTGILAGLAFVISILLLRETLTASGRPTEFIYFRF